MDEEAAVKLTNKISAIIKKVKGDDQFYHRLKKAAQDEAEKITTRTSSMTDDVKQGLKADGWETKLKNEVFKIMSRNEGLVESPEENHQEPLAYMRKAQANWERRIAKSINSMCSEMGNPLSRQRHADEQRKFLHNWNQLGVDEPDLSKIRPVYAPKDFLDVISGVRNPNAADPDDSGRGGGSSVLNWGLIQVQLETPTLQELQQQFSELDPSADQIGLDDYMDKYAGVTPVEDQRIKMAKKILDEGDSVRAYKLCRRGIPTAHRADMWQLALGVTIDHLDILRYAQLRKESAHYELLVDNLIYKDVKLTAVNDDYYFVFEDYLHQVLLVFSRDTSLLERFKYVNITPPQSFIRGKLGTTEDVVTYPPNGVIPFHGFSMYAAPFCYLYQHGTSIYFVFREFYSRHLHRLHCISSHPQGIISLCLTFENILQQQHPKLFRHLIDINVQPLKIALKWMMRAFAGYLATDQLFQLWDRVIGFGSLLLLPVLSVAIFVFRQSNLIAMTSQSQVEAALSDLTPVRVIPLIQMILFPA